MAKILAAFLAGIPTYLFLGALDVGMADGAARAIVANSTPVAPVVAAAPAPGVVTLPRVEIVGTRISAESATLVAAKR